MMAWALATEIGQLANGVTRSSAQIQHSCYEGQLSKPKAVRDALRTIRGGLADVDAVRKSRLAPMTLPSHSDVELLDLAQLGAGLGGQCGSTLEHLLSGRRHQVRAPGVSVKPEDVEGFSPLRGVLIGTQALFPPVPAVTQRPSSAARTRSAYARQTPVP